MPNEETMETKRKLEELEKRILRLEKTFIKESDEETSKAVKSEQLIRRLAQKTGVSTEDIEKTFDLEEESLTLVNIFGRDDRERTKNVTLLVLLGYRYFFSKDDVLSKEIRRNIAENRIPLSNFSTYVNEITPSFVRRKGKSRSPMTTYRLTTLGEAEARRLLKQSTNR